MNNLSFHFCGKRAHFCVVSFYLFLKAKMYKEVCMFFSLLKNLYKKYPLIHVYSFGNVKKVSARMVSLRERSKEM